MKIKILKKKVKKENKVIKEKENNSQENHKQ
jgi:hypothetical protein